MKSKRYKAKIIRTEERKEEGTIFSKKSRYGLTALVDLAIYANGQCVQLASIAERNHISVKYLEQIFSSMKRAGLVKSVKGPQGGYLLARHPKDITAATVISVLDGSYLLEDEGTPGKMDEKGISTAIQKLLVEKINEQLDERLHQVTLETLLDYSEEYSEMNQAMYYI